MESERRHPTSAEQARRQLEELDADQRWAGLVNATPDLFQIMLIGACIVSLVLFTCGWVGVGPDPEGQGLFALSLLASPFVGEARVLHEATGSYVGVPGKRPRTWEIVVAVTGYLAGLVVAFWSADRGWWPVVGLTAILVGVLAGWCGARWMRRYREDNSYRTSPRLVRAVALYVVVLALCIVVTITIWSIVVRWVA